MKPLYRGAFHIQRGFGMLPGALYTMHAYICTFLSFYPHIGEVVGSQVPRKLFARNRMKCADLHRKIMF